MSNRLLVSVVGSLLSIGFFSASTARAELVHPRMHRAVHEMEEAKAELEAAPKVFGAHKMKAIEALDAATGELKAALNAVGEPYKGFKAKEARKGGGRHPRITSAIHELRETETYLKNADHDFKGHKAKAMKLIASAIAELEAALEFAKK
jgi:hypothetical protein